MSSILTNASAMTALKTLQQTNKGLEATQGRISTGLRVAQASDNAAYWSIATTMRSDNKAMSTVKDALGLGAAQVDVAYTAMDSVKNTLDKIKSKLVAASQPDVDKGKIQEEINQLQNDLKTFANSATFSGGNWLSVNGSSEQKIVASFIRNDSGAISLGTIDVDTAKTALFNSKSGEVGILQQGAEVTFADDTDGVDFDTTAATDGDAIEIDVLAHDFDTTGTGTTISLEAGNTIKFDVTVNGKATAVTIDLATLDGVTLATAGIIADEAELADVMNAALTKAGLSNVVASGTAGDGAVKLALNDADGNAVNYADADPDANTLSFGNVRSSSNGNFFDATKLNIVGADTTKMEEYIQGIDQMFTAVTTAASDLGAMKSRISSQQEFVTDLMNAVDRGVGALVDANMNEESTRLQALQVQQQLGIQALSIANGSAQSILSLFRG
jgi:flagellin